MGINTINTAQDSCTEFPGKKQAAGFESFLKLTSGDGQYCIKRFF